MSSIDMGGNAVPTHPKANVHYRLGYLLATVESALGSLKDRDSAHATEILQAAVDLDLGDFTKALEQEEALPS